MVDSIIAKIDSSVTLMSERLNFLADYDNDLAKQDSLLIKQQTPQIVRSLRTRIGYLQCHKNTYTMKNKTARKRAAAKLMLSVLPVISSLAGAKHA